MKKIIYIAIASVALAGLSACNDDFLDRSPKGAVTDATAFSSYESCTAYVRSMYGVFSSRSYQGPAPVNDAFGTSYRDLSSGILTNYGKGFSTIPNDYAAQNRTIPTSSSSYSEPYERIRQANILLSHLSEVEASDAQKLHLEAVTRFFRAYSHYALLVNYGDCIYVDKLLTDTSEELTSSKSSRQYVADQIYKELEWCIANVQDDLAEANTVNSDVIKAFMSRFCLFEGTWRKYHSVSDESGTVSANDLLKTCLSVSKELTAKYPTLYKGDSNDKHPGKGWGQMWTSEDLAKVPGVLLYNKYIPDIKMHRLGHFEHIASASLEMPQSTVDLYLTVDGLPIHNAAVKTYDYADGVYTESEEPYDYANANPYRTFRKRDPRLWQMVTPPYHVILAGGSNDWKLDNSAGGMYSEYVLQFAPRGTYNAGADKYTSPNFNVAYHQVETHKSLPSTNWAGNVLVNVPHTVMSDKTAFAEGKIAYYSGKGFQRGKSGYFVWKHVANWDRQWSSGVADVAAKPIFKIEEVYLNYAEAAFELGQFNQSVADETINRLRERAGVGRMNVSAIDGNFDPDRDTTVDPVLWEIRRERLVELMGESFSFEDVRRWKKGSWYVNKQAYGAWVDADNIAAVVSKTGGSTGVMNNTTHTEASASDVVAQGGGHLYYYLDPVKAGKGWLDKYYLEPIPSEELLLNENLKQQDLWK